MKDKNSFILGILLGTLIPVIGFLLLNGVYELLESAGWVSAEGFRPKFRERTTAIIALALNAILLSHYQKKYLNNTVRGIVIVTVIWVVVWLVRYGQYVL